MEDLVEIMLELLNESNKMDMPGLQAKVTRSIVVDFELVQLETWSRSTSIS